MSNAMVGRLIRKDLSLNRLFMTGAAVAGLLSLGICLLGKTAFGVGGIMFITVMVAYAVILPMFTIVGERKERSRLFVLSLPVSRGQYVLAKVLGATFTFLIPCAVLLMVALALILVTPIPDGMVVFTILLTMFALTDFCVIACAAMLIDGDGPMAVVIIFMNMSVTFFIVGITNLTRIGKDMSVDVVNWSPPAIAILSAEIAVVVLAFIILFWIAGREPEVV